MWLWAFCGNMPEIGTFNFYCTDSTMFVGPTDFPVTKRMYLLNGFIFNNLTQNIFLIVLLELNNFLYSENS